jgi:hypothetical protein
MTVPKEVPLHSGEDWNRNATIKRRSHVQVRRWLITIHSAEVELLKSILKLLEHESKKLGKDSIGALFYSILSELIGRYEQVYGLYVHTVLDVLHYNTINVLITNPSIIIIV